MNSVATSTQSTSSEQYLSLYLGLMISIFCIVLVADGSQELFPIAEQAIVYPDEATGSSPEPILEIPFQLFQENRKLDEIAFMNVMEILRAHDLRAEIQLYSSLEDAENRFGQALALQYRFAREGLLPVDILTEVMIDEDGDKASKLFLYPDTRSKW